MKEWVSVLLLVLPATLLVLEVKARPSEHEDGEGHHGSDDMKGFPSQMLRKMFVSQMCSQKKSQNCMEKMSSCLNTLYPGEGLPNGSPEWESTCGVDFECRWKATDCLMFMQPDKSVADNICDKVNVPKCRDKVVRCLALPSPGSAPASKLVEVINNCKAGPQPDLCPEMAVCMEIMAGAYTEPEPEGEYEPEPEGEYEPEPEGEYEPEPEGEYEPEPEGEYEPEPGQKGEPEKLTVPECKAEMVECMNMLEPGPEEMPDEDKVCSSSTDPDCRAKFKKCMMKMHSTGKEADTKTAEDMMCMDNQLDDCPARAMACKKAVHPDKAFMKVKKECFIKAPGCPADPMTDPATQESMLMCLEPDLRKHMEGLDNSVFPSYETCFTNNLMEGFMCLMKSCIPKITL
ncbi:uncharacterized protein [Panulirus ornatus]|uniref:uncharacterized protein n=1 Tax=Panulirus ornatus TaxID=150431 RepID=UPI003A89B5FF